MFFWAFAPEFRIISRRAEPSTTPQDAGSKRLIAIGPGAAMFAAFWIAATVPLAALPHRVWLFWLGIMAIIGGSLLRRHCCSRLLTVQVAASLHTASFAIYCWHCITDNFSL